MNVRLLLILLVLAAFLCSCGSKPSDSPTAEPPEAKAVPLAVKSGGPAPPPPPLPGQAPAAATDLTPTNPPVPEEGVTLEPFNTALVDLQEAVDQYMQDMERTPKSLQEIVAAGFLERLPEPSKGKKFVIDQESFQVKEVPRQANEINR
ncbi:MAG: hypothetical protein AB1705_20825 [Verrucomicrobiota bacterium]